MPLGFPDWAAGSPHLVGMNPIICLQLVKSTLRACQLATKQYKCRLIFFMCKFHIDTLKKLSVAGIIRMHTFGFLVGLFSCIRSEKVQQQYWSVP